MNSSFKHRAIQVMIVAMIVAGVVFIVPRSGAAQGCGGRGGTPPGSSGTKFLLVFMKNEEAGYMINPQRYQDIYLAPIDTMITTQVTITCRAFPGWSKVISLPPHSSAAYRISADPIIGYPNQDAIIEIPEVPDSTVFKVVASAPITCYGMNNKTYTADAFLALPFDPATPDYIVMAYGNSSDPNFDSGDPQPSEFSVASFEDKNTVTIIPAARTSSGNPKLKPMTFVLDSGECVLIEADINDLSGDMTGSIVRSTRPVVVYGGSARTEAPSGYNIDQITSRDHLCEAIPPLSTWGTSFIAKNFGRADGDMMRVLASVDNTVVRINGNIWGTPLRANEHRDTNVAQSGIAVENIAAVESTQPILVGMIAHTSDQTSKIGDPFLAIVPPLQQTYNAFTYFITTDTAASGNYDPNQQFLIVATEKSGAGKISIDGNIPLPPAAYTMLPTAFSNGKQYAVATIKQSPGIHQIVSQNPLPENGFTILAYGWGNVISYGYTAGQLLVPLKGIIPLTSPTQGVAPSPGDPVPTVPSIIVRNILAEKIYFDSAKVSYLQNNQHLSVRLKKDIATEISTILMAEEKTLELATSIPVQDAVSGTIRIWYHTAKWTTLMPVDFPFTINPQSQTAVTLSNPQAIVLENYPNPVAGRMTIQYNIPTRAFANIKIYDALGRTVKIIKQGMMESGEQNMQISVKDFIPGEYTLELTAPELGISAHRKLIVIQ